MLSYVKQERICDCEQYYIYKQEKVHLSWVEHEKVLWSWGLVWFLNLKELSKIVADDILLIICFFRENKTCHFMWIV